MYVLTSGTDEVHTPTSRAGHELLRYQPWLKPSHETLHALKELSEPPVSDAGNPLALPASAASLLATHRSKVTNHRVEGAFRPSSR